MNANAAIARIQNNSSLNNARIGFLFKPYNYIVSEALSDNLISYVNDVVSDNYINGEWQNPYGEDVLYGFAIGNDGEVALSVDFTIDNLDTLSITNFSGILFDAGDGYGFRSVSIGVPFHINYSSSGYTETKLKIFYGNKEYISHSLLYIKSSPQIPAPGSSTMVITSFEADFNGRTYEAKTSSLSGSFNKPLIVSEGFDPWLLSNDNRIHSFSGFNDYNSFIAALNNSYIDLSDFDIVYVDWRDCGADIRANAKVLEEIITWVNENKTTSNANVVLGQSMGGLIARYCLRDMEVRNVPHDTRLFISHDAPHLGVNISPGLQFAYWDLYDWTNLLSGFFTLFDSTNNLVTEFMRLGNYKSVRQMLPVYVSLSGQYDNTDYTELQSELSLMGFPQGYNGRSIENVAIVNGGNTSSGYASLYSNSDKLIHADFSVTTGPWLEVLLLISELNLRALWIPGRSTLSFNYDVYPYLNNSSLVRSCDITFTKKFLWLFSKTFNIVHKTDLAPSSGTCYDLVSSSYYEPYGFMLSNAYDENELPWSLIGSIESEFSIANRIAFIPTASAFSYPDYSRNYFSNHVSPGIQTPFTSYILQDTLSYHTSFWSNIDDWLKNVNKEIHIPPVAFTGDTLSIPGATVPFTWTTSSSSVASVYNGIVSQGTGGLVEFKAISESPDFIISKTGKAIVGYPQVSLKSESLSQYEAIVSISASDETKYFIDQAVDNGILTYKWGVKSGTGNTISWRTTQQDTIHVSIPNGEASVTVYMKWQRFVGNEETVQREIQVYQSNNYLINLEGIQVRGIAVRYSFNPLLDWSQITTQYGHDCLTFTRSLYQGIPNIQSISIGSQTFPVSGISYVTISPRMPKLKVYVFDILYDEDFHDTFMYNPDFINSNACVLSVVINSANGPIQTCQIPCILRIDLK